MMRLSSFCILGIYVHTTSNVVKAESSCPLAPFFTHSLDGISSHTRSSRLYACECVCDRCLCVCLRLSLIWGTPDTNTDLMNELTWQPLRSACELERAESERGIFCWMKNVFIHLFRLHLSPCTSASTCTFYPKRDSASVSFHRFSTRRANIFYTWFPPFFPFPTHIYTGCYTPVHVHTYT